ncbi:MAG: hypothetical protein ABF271_14680 [Abyssibacter sp.]|uniref:hypothetical protein n=1 Tax=Abyssibacter sp. TaxID=2320200 RepID=UPI00321A1DF4
MDAVKSGAICLLAVLWASGAAAAGPTLDLAHFDTRIETLIKTDEPRPPAPSVSVTVSGWADDAIAQGYVELIDGAGRAWLPTALLAAPAQSGLQGWLPPLPAGIAALRLTLKLENVEGAQWVQFDRRLPTGPSLLAADWTLTTDHDSAQLQAWYLEDPRPWLSRWLPTLPGFRDTVIRTPTAQAWPRRLTWAQARCSEYADTLAEVDSTLSAAARQHPALLAWRVACAVSSDHRARAAELLRLAAEQNRLDEALARLGLELARADLDRHRLDRALATLDRIRPQIPSESDALWRHLQSLALLRIGQPERAVALLSTGPHLGPLVQWASGQGDERLHGYMRLNYAIALMQSGDVDLGLTLLDDLGQRVPHDGEALALRDQANGLLGWTLLRRGQAAHAVAAFDRMYTRSPSGVMGLLGLGWALSAEPGPSQARPPLPVDATQVTAAPTQTVLVAMQQSGALACEQARVLLSEAATPCAVPQTLPRVWPDQGVDDRRLRAAALWATVAEQPGAGLAGVEARIARADVLSQLGHTADAQAELASALAQLDQAGAAGDAVRSSLATALPMTLTPQWVRRIANNDPILAPMLTEWAASDAVHHGMTMVRQLEALLNPPAGDVSQTAVRQLQEELLARLTEDAITTLAATEARLREYRLAAHLRLARLHDQPTTQ